MTAKTAKKTAPVAIKAPKISSAWLKVVSTANNSEAETIKAIENLSAVMVLESRLTIRDIQKVIKETGKVCGAVSVAHIPALATWSKLRAKHADFRALPRSKQLSTATSAYDVLGAGKGEGFKSLEILTKEIKTVRKAKGEARKAGKSAPATPAKAKASNLDAIKAFTALVSTLDFSSLSDAEAEALAMLQIALEDKALVQA